MRLGKDLAHSILDSVGLTVSRSTNHHMSSATIQPWLECLKLRALMERPLRYSLVSRDRMFMLLQWLDFALAAAGDVAEFGVWRGGTALLLHERLSSRAPNRTLHLF